MTLDQAFTQFIKSQDFKDIARQKDTLGGKYRVYLLRFNKGELKSGAIVDVLLANGYEISAKKVVRKKK